ncbi:MAG: biotin/lipoyl-binding protein [Candidatus Midichloriaceae bacterium]|jgi:RND family efflux transporter MFP subunit|nr:biotin/lipoyl-binding protein [Candidatus Midichloriaceae bacterium]
MNILELLKKNWKFPLIAAIGIIFAMISVLSRPEAEKHQPLVMPPKASYQSAIAGIGVIEPKSEVISIGVELPGVVRIVHVKVGDKVEKGSPLFSLDQRDIDAQIAILESSLITAEAQLADATAQFDIASSIEDKRAIAKDDFNRRKYAKQIAAGKVKEIMAQLRQAKITKERMVVNAPIAGEILEINIRPGEYANIGSLPNPLIIMGDMESVHVRVEIDEENSARVLAQSPAKAMVRGKPDQYYPLTFVKFEPYVKPKQNLATTGQRVDTRVLRVVYELPKIKERLFVGQQMDVYIEEALKME